MEGQRTIGIVANTTWNIFNFRLNILEKFTNEGWNIIVFAPIDEYIEYKEKFPNVKHISIRTLKRDGRSPFRDFLLMEELRRKYKRFSLDVVLHYTHKPNIFGALAAKLAGIPSVAVVTGLGYPFLKKGWIESVVKQLYKLTSSLNKINIFENEDDRILFIKKGLVDSENAKSVKGCGVNLSHFVPIDSYQRNGMTKFTFIGRLLYDKGIKEFVEAAIVIKEKYQNKAKFTIVGEIDKDNPSSINPDDLTTWMEQGIIEYKGYLRDVRGIIASSDCIVLPSYREAIARSLTEAMAMGKPVIATETAGCREAVDDGQNGFLVPIRDSKSLVISMDKIINMDNEALIKMGKIGREKSVREFDDKIIADEIFDIIVNALSN